jgi:hypothetical protein
MSMIVKVDIKPKSFRGVIKKRRTNALGSVKTALTRTASVGVRMILDRTEKGKNIDGQRFKKYSKDYAEWKTTSTAKGGGGKTSITPNLHLSGKMLSSITTRVTRTKATLSFTRGRELDKATRNNKSRPFFGFSRAEQKELGRAFERFMK